MTLFHTELVCQQAVELITAYLDGALGRRERRRLERHLQSCPNCTAYLEQIRITIAAIGAVPTETLSEEARSDLIALFEAFHAEDDNTE